jgi:hypothetical protein
MATKNLPGEEPGQLLTLLDRWQTSLDLHARYSALDEARYWRVQPWPKHARPQRWTIQLARKRILALRRIVAQRQAEGDRAFIEGVEIMGFLATTVGLSSMERFIPLATPELERRDVLAAASQPSPVKVVARARQAARETPVPSPRREMRREPVRPVTVKPKRIPSAVTQTEHVVIADAVRLLGWGKQWHELAEMIARLAERPSPSEIRRILRTYREQIDAVATRRRD